MVRTIIYKYTRVLGLLKLLMYKLAYGQGLRYVGLPSISCRSRIRIRNGGKLDMKKGAHMDEGTLIRVTNEGKMIIGKGSGFNSYCVVTCRHRIEIGNNVIFGPFVTIHDHDHIFRGVDNYSSSGYDVAPIIIEDNVWVGGNVVILKGVRIGTGSVIAAGSIVTKDIPPHTIVHNKTDRVERDICSL